MAGYSGVPLARKLGYKPGFRALLRHPPAGYREALGPLDGVAFAARLVGAFDLIHGFWTEAAALSAELPRLLAALRPEGMLWVSWPKQAAGVPTDVKEGTIRAAALPLGLVDVKVCAVDDTWSGLKLVIRRELRPAHPRRG